MIVKTKYLFRKTISSRNDESVFFTSKILENPSWILEQYTYELTFLNKAITMGVINNNNIHIFYFKIKLSIFRWLIHDYLISMLSTYI